MNDITLRQIRADIATGKPEGLAALQALHDHLTAQIDQVLAMWDGGLEDMQAAAKENRGEDALAIGRTCTLLKAIVEGLVAMRRASFDFCTGKISQVEYLSSLGQVAPADN